MKPTDDYKTGDCPVCLYWEPEKYVDGEKGQLLVGLCMNDECRKCHLQTPQFYECDDVVEGLDW